MRVKLQLVMCSDDGQEETITDVITLQKDSQRIEHLGLTLREAKQLLTTIQKRLLQHQVEAFLDGCSTCPDCGTPLKAKGYQSRSFRTVFGTFKLSPSNVHLVLDFLGHYFRSRNVATIFVCRSLRWFLLGTARMLLVTS